MDPLPRRCRKPATAANAQKRLGIVIHARNFGERRRISLKTPRFVVCFQGFGGMAEWLKAAVLKTVVPQGTVGSNPTSSARYVTGQAICLACFRLKGRRPSMEREITPGVYRHFKGNEYEVIGIAKHSEQKSPWSFTARSMASAASGRDRSTCSQAKSIAISTPTPSSDTDSNGRNRPPLLKHCFARTSPA